MRLLIANRGEIAIRIARAARELDLPCLAVYSEDDSDAPHTRSADDAVALDGVGPAAYLNHDAVLQAAIDGRCDAVHPGYGFLSESADFARHCAEAGITFVGPSPQTLELFGDKSQARALASEHGVPVPAGLSHPASLEQVGAFFGQLNDGDELVIKAVGGGGGRGMRLVKTLDELEGAYTRARSEAKAAFGRAEVYAEQRITGARHVEVQIAGDDDGNVIALGDRDCSLQRRHQKLVEIAPAPYLSDALRERITEAALTLAHAAGYTGLGTFEFLVRDGRTQVDQAQYGAGEYYFIEANARLQVEHTVTEEVTGIDLVQLQLELAQGRSLAELGLEPTNPPTPRGHAIQTRVNMETVTADGQTRPSSGRLSVFEPPTGPGLRTDTFATAGLTPSPRFDSLLAKVVAHSSAPELDAALRRARRGLEELRIEGLQTNVHFLLALLERDDVGAMRLHTTYVDEHLLELAGRAAEIRRELSASNERQAEETRLAGAKVDEADPLAVLAYGKSSSATSERTRRPGGAARPEITTPGGATGVAGVAGVAAPDGTSVLLAPMQGTIVALEVAEGDEIREGSTVLVMEAMKMEHEVAANATGIVGELLVVPGDTVYEGSPLVLIEDADLEELGDEGESEIDLDSIRPDLAEVLERHAVTLDEARPDAVEKRRRTHQRTARENIDDLCDPGSFVEHGQLGLTPGTGLPLEQVIRKFPTDGMVTGVGSVNGGHFPGEASRCVVMSYDYTVLAGTQGALNHPKTDRMLELAERYRRPVVLFAEGGGGRAGTGGKRKGGQSTTNAGQGRSDEAYRPLDTPTFTTMARLSGLVPLVGVTSRWCFAGNAALLGCCDVIIATADSSIGMGGPALIEGGGLGVFRPEEVGPMDVQVPNGVVDVAVADEEEAVAVAKQYLSYFQGALETWESPDTRRLRNVVPENRLRVYQVRDVITGLADVGSVLELRPGFGLGMVTALARVEGRPIGILANNPEFLSGAIDSDGSDKAARFLQLCDAFDVPVLVLCDTPGMMVGPEIERTALVRHCSRLFVTGANLSVPLLTIVLRKAYGLGAQAMAGGDLKRPFFTVAWPTGEFGGMGLEGQVKLGFRNELEAIDDPTRRRSRYEELVAAAYERGKALNAGVSFAVDDVIDPADSRRWIARALDSLPTPPARTGKKRSFVDTW